MSTSETSSKSTSSKSKSDDVVNPDYTAALEQGYYGELPEPADGSDRPDLTLAGVTKGS